MPEAFTNGSLYFTPSFLAFAILGLILWTPLIRKFSWRPPQTLVLLLYTALLLGLMISPLMNGQTGFSLAGVLLFIPFGFLCVLATCRYWQALLAGILVSVAVELMRALTIVERSFAPLDVAANTAGTFLGILLACLFIAMRMIYHERKSNKK